MIKGLHIVFAFFISTFAMAQQSITFSLVAEKNKIEIGDPIQMSMRVTYPAHVSPASIQFPVLEAGISINDTIDILTVTAVKNNSSTDNQGNPTQTWQQDFTVGIYAGGNIEVGPFDVIVGAAEDADTISSNVATISVSTPELQEDAEFIGIKGIEQDPFTFWEKLWMWLKTYWVWILIPVLLIVGTIILVKYLNKKPEENIVQAPKIPLPITLLNKLESIEAEQLWQQGKHKEYYSDVTDVIRRFLEYKYQIPALEKTSDEILQSLSLSAINKNDYNQLKNLFSLANMIKFAKSMPVAEENVQAMTIAKGLINKEIRKTQ